MTSTSSTPAKVLRLHHLPRAGARRLRFAERSERNEEDLLDKAWGLEAVSRLSCQAVVADEDSGHRNSEVHHQPR
jgi:hypothetical protein